MSLGRVALGAAVLALVVLVGLVVRYESARGAWRAVSAVDAPGYDAAASDARYREVEEALVWVERGARLDALLIVIAGLALGRGVSRRDRSELTGARRALARGLDVASLALVLAISRLRVASPGITEALAWLLPAALAATLLGLAVQGASLGERAMERLTRRGARPTPPRDRPGSAPRS